MRGFLSPLICAALLSACSSNIFSAVETHDPADRALGFLDDKNPDDAIAVLEDALEENGDDWILVSLMATAKAQKAGVDTTEVAIKMATPDEEGESEEGGNALTDLFDVMPEATAESVGLMGEAVSYINRIPVEERVSADTFKLTMYNTAYTALQTKFFDGDGDGKFTVEELQSLDEATAVAILESLLNAENAAASYTEGDTTGQAAGKVSAIVAQINGQEGASTSEKLRNFLGAGSAAAL